MGYLVAYFWKVERSDANLRDGESILLSCAFTGSAADSTSGRKAEMEIRFAEKNINLHIYERESEEAEVVFLSLLGFLLCWCGIFTTLLTRDTFPQTEKSHFLSATILDILRPSAHAENSRRNARRPRGS